VVVVGVDDHCSKLAIGILSSPYSERTLCLSRISVFASLRLMDSTRLARISILATLRTDPGTVFWSCLLDTNGIPILAGVGM
jgi:hypothetical protein